MTIEFLPSDIRHRDITPKLLQSLTTSYSVEGSIAFWTLGIADFSGKLLSALTGASSTMCVDVQWPTNLEKLAQFAKELAKKRSSEAFYICLRKQPGDARTEEVSLLHTKLLLFNFGNQEWEIWIGSHNFTKQALKGRNLEASIRIRGKAAEPSFKVLLNQVRTYLEYIKTLCQPFDPDKVSYYEALRGEVNINRIKEELARELAAKVAIEEMIISRVLSLQCEQANQLAGQTIIILGNLFDELSILRQRNRGGSPVYLRVMDTDSGVIVTYKARMRAFDNIDDWPSFNVSFNQRRWAIRTVTKKGEAIEPPFLQPIQDVGPDLIESRRYYANVQVIECVAHDIIEYYTYPETDVRILWHEQYDLIEPHSLLSFPRADESTRPSKSISLVPVANAEEMTSIRRISWDAAYKDGLLDRRIIVLGTRRQ